MWTAIVVFIVLAHLYWVKRQRAERIRKAREETQTMYENIFQGLDYDIVSLSFDEITPDK